MQWGHVIQHSEEAWFDRLKQQWLCGVCGGSGRVTFDHYLRKEAQQTEARRQCFACNGTGKPRQIPPPPISTTPNMATDCPA